MRTSRLFYSCDSFAAAKKQIVQTFFCSRHLSPASIRGSVQRYLRPPRAMSITQENSWFRSRVSLLLHEAKFHHGSVVAEEVLKCVVSRGNSVVDQTWVEDALQACRTQEERLRLQDGVRSFCLTESQGSPLSEVFTALLEEPASRDVTTNSTSLQQVDEAGVLPADANHPMFAPAVQHLRMQREMSVTPPNAAFSRYFLRQRIVSSETELIAFVAALRRRPAEALHAHHSGAFGAAAVVEVLEHACAGCLRRVRWLPSTYHAYTVEVNNQNSGPALHELLSTRRRLKSLAQDGLIAHQSTSSMLAVYYLHPMAGERVMDLCSSPGSKATLIADVMVSQFEKEGVAPISGALVCNDRSRERAAALHKRMLSHSFPFVEVCEGDGGVGFRDAVFDKVLVDAPCSGESRLSRDGQSYRMWHPQQGIAFHHRQVALLQQAIRLCVRGGKILYCTCTFNPLENEAVLAAVLRANPHVRLTALPALKASDGGPTLSPALRRWLVPASDGQLIASHAEAERRGEGRQLKESLFCFVQDEGVGEGGQQEEDGVLSSISRHARRLLPHCNHDAEGFFYGLLEVVGSAAIPRRYVPHSSSASSLSSLPSLAAVDTHMLVGCLLPFLTPRASQDSASSSSGVVQQFLQEHRLEVTASNEKDGVHVASVDLVHASLSPNTNRSSRPSPSIRMLGTALFDGRGVLLGDGAALLRSLPVCTERIVSIPLVWLQLLLRQSEIVLNSEAEGTHATAVEDIRQAYPLLGKPAEPTPLPPTLYAQLKRLYTADSKRNTTSLPCCVIVVADVGKEPPHSPLWVLQRWSLAATVSAGTRRVSTADAAHPCPPLELRLSLPASSNRWLQPLRALVGQLRQTQRRPLGPAKSHHHPSASMSLEELYGSKGGFFLAGAGEESSGNRDSGEAAEVPGPRSIHF